MKKQKCTKIVKEKLEILLQIDEDNIQVLSKIQKLSCTKFIVNDFIAITEYGDEYFILEPSGRKRTNSGISPRNSEVFKISDDKKTAVKTYLEKGFSFIIIDNKQQIDLLKLATKSKIRIGDHCVIGNYVKEIVSKEEFEENYIIV